MPSFKASILTPRPPGLKKGECGQRLWWETGRERRSLGSGHGRTGVCGQGHREQKRGPRVLLLGHNMNKQPKSPRVAWL